MFLFMFFVFKAISTSSSLACYWPTSANFWTPWRQIWVKRADRGKRPGEIPTSLACKSLGLAETCEDVVLFVLLFSQ